MRWDWKSADAADTTQRLEKLGIMYQMAFQEVCCCNPFFKTFEGSNNEAKKEVEYNGRELAYLTPGLDDRPAVSVGRRGHGT